MSEVIDTSKNPSALQLAQREIEQLQKRIGWLESGYIHSCHAECKKPLCVANREIEKLKAQLADKDAALEFYADENNYNHFPATSDPNCMAFVGFVIEKEAGDKAREVLQKYKKDEV